MAERFFHYPIARRIRCFALARVADQIFCRSSPGGSDCFALACVADQIFCNFLARRIRFFALACVADQIFFPVLKKYYYLKRGPRGGNLIRPHPRPAPDIAAMPGLLGGKGRGGAQWRPGREFWASLCCKEEIGNCLARRFRIALYNMTSAPRCRAQGKRRPGPRPRPRLITQATQTFFLFGWLAA